MLKKIINIVISLLFATLVGGVISNIFGLNIQIAGVNAAPIALIAFLFGSSFLPILPHGSLAYTIGNLVRPVTPNAGKGGDKQDKITLIRCEDVLTFPTPDANGIVIAGNFVMKPGCYAIDVYGTQDSIKVNPKSEGGMDEKGVMHNIEFTHPGLEKEVLEFRNYWMNENCYAIINRCSTSTKHLYGGPCAKLQMAFDCQDDKDATKTKFTLTSAQKGPDQFIYQGTLTYQSVTGTVAADATSIDATAGSGQYQLTDGTVAAVTITTLTNIVDGAVYTLLGSGGTYPSTITSANDFVLKNGTTWTAISGATITFAAFKVGVSSWKFIELSRS